MAKQRRTEGNGNGGDLGFEAELFKAADKLTRQHGAQRLQARRPGVDLPQAHLRQLRGQARRAAGRLPRGRRGPGRVRRRERLLGAQVGALVASEGHRQAARHRQAHRRGHAHHREGQRLAEGRAAQGVRPSGAQRRHARRAHRPDLRHHAGRRWQQRPRPARARLRVLPGPVRRLRGQARRRVLHPTLGGAGAGADARTLPGQGAQDPGPGLRPLLRLRRHVRAGRAVSGRPTAGASASWPSTGRRATTPPGAYAR